MYIGLICAAENFGDTIDDFSDVMSDKIEGFKSSRMR